MKKDENGEKAIKRIKVKNTLKKVGISLGLGSITGTGMAMALRTAMKNKDRELYNTASKWSIVGAVASGAMYATLDILYDKINKTDEAKVTAIKVNEAAKISKDIASKMNEVVSKE